MKNIFLGISRQMSGQCAVGEAGRLGVYGRASIRAVVPLLIFSLLVFSCAGETNIDSNELANIDFGGKVQRIETLGHYSQADAVVFLNLPQFQDSIETTSGFYLFRVTYRTVNYDNSSILVSGLLAIPDSKTIKGIVCWNHGTNSERASAPSEPTIEEGVAVSALFAGNEFMLLAPDYIGLGVSKEVPTYMHTASTVKTILDYLTVGSKILDSFTDGKENSLYMVGFSQGGSATAGVHRALEISNPTGLVLKGSAAVAGAYNLKDISVKYAIENNSTFYLGYLANSYSMVYGQSLATIIQSEYANSIPGLYNGSKSVDYVEKHLPSSVNKLYVDSMVNDIQTGASNWFTDALDQNETYKWKPVVKLKLYYGSKDTDVSPQDSLQAHTYMKGVGGNVEVINAGETDHFGSLLASLPDIQKWFNRLYSEGK